MEKKAIIIGAGPAGLTAAYELLTRTDLVPVILEKSGDIGGISKTVNYKGNRIDIGGHRFFSKSDRVMNWWQGFMPVQTIGEEVFTISYQNSSRKVELQTDRPAVKEDAEKVMLIRNRLSRIYFLRKFFAYPISFSFDTVQKLGLVRIVSILFSYVRARIFPIKPMNNLEDFFINKFGRKLYKTFFKDYTEKVWGIPCNKIAADWGAQRIKGVSVSKAIGHAVKSILRRNRSNSDIMQKDTETSLIEKFLYPKYGPGQLWEEVARQVTEKGGEILMQHQVVKINTDKNRIISLEAVDEKGKRTLLEGDYFFSTMPVQELIAGMNEAVPEHVQTIAAGLQYRDFITVGLLLKKLSSFNKSAGVYEKIELKDTWIYVQESDVKVGRLQIFNNWSPYMVKEKDNVWIGLEYFCNTSDDFWKLSDEQLKKLAAEELEKIGLAQQEDVIDATVIRMEKTYPAYFGTYKNFDEIRAFTDQFSNLFLIGRNGMHKYNNSDHSMLTAMVAVDNILAGKQEKENIWGINAEQEYHEEKSNEYA